MCLIFLESDLSESYIELRKIELKNVFNNLTCLALALSDDKMESFKNHEPLRYVATNYQLLARKRLEKLEKIKP